MSSSEPFQLEPEQQPDLLVVSSDRRDDGLDRGAIVARAISFCLGLLPFPRTHPPLTVESVRRTAARPCYVVVAESGGPLVEAAFAGIAERCGGCVDSDDNWCYVLPLLDQDAMPPPAKDRIRSIELAAFELGGYVIERARREQAESVEELQLGKAEDGPAQ